MINWMDVGRQIYRSRRSIALSLCIAMLLAYELWRSHAAAREEAEKTVSNLVHVMSEQLVRTVQSIDLNLQDIAAEIVKRPELADNDPAFRGALHKRLTTLPYVRALFVIGPDGFISHDTDFPGTPRVSLADRGYFRTHETDPSVQMHIDGPLKSRSRNVWFISLSRRINAESGAFGGIVVAAVEPLYFEHFYTQLWMSGGTILLALADGTLLARSPHNEQAMGVSFADDEPFRSYLRAQRSGVYWGRSPIDGVSRVIGYQRLNSIPVVVLMTLDEADAMKEWRSHARAGIVGAVILQLLLLALEWLSYRSREREEKARIRLERAQRLEAIGRFAAGVAHDIGNLMRIIRSGVTVLRPMMESRQEALAVLGEIDRTLSAGRDMVSQLLSQSRNAETRPEVADVNRLLSDALPILAQAAGPRTGIATALSDEEAPCLVDRAQFRSAIVNLVLNARDAMPSGGTITIGTLVVEERNGDAVSRWVDICIGDEGVGMTDDVRHQAFDPFFTTKPPGSGSGVGLSQVVDFVRRSGGRVEILSRKDRGTTVRLRLPIEVGATAARRSDRKEDQDD